jgi:hypothetical protein
MTGGLLQLVAYGAQDVYLTGNPQITFFKIVYRRHTNFAIESVQQTFNGTTGYDKRVTAQISRNGDLIHKMYVVMNLKRTSVAAVPTSRLGHYLLKKVELEIGGQLIDRQYSEWMYIWNELSLPKGKQVGFDQMVGGINDKGLKINTTPVAGTYTVDPTDTTTLIDPETGKLILSGSTAEVVNQEKERYKLYVPLEFWFCRNIGLSLPLIALQYHEVKVNIEFREDTSTNKALLFDDATLWVDYIFLDTDERRRFAQLSHEYLIEQVQHTGQESIDNGGTKLKLNFNHPVKQLIWMVRKDVNVKDSSKWIEFQDMQYSTSKLQLNGNDRFSEREGMYFTHVQPYQHHENIPENKNISVYSFGLKPEEHQPSGTLNMSRIDTAVLHINATGTDNTMKLGLGSDVGSAYVYAVNYNVLRILSGMGGLAYSN